jgi:hypothetical protein
MCRRTVWLTALALATCVSSGCGLMCDRYCERMHDRCERFYNRGGCYAPVPAAPACPPGCTPAPVAYYANPTHP